MSRTNTVLLKNFLDFYENPIPYIPQTKKIQLVLSIAPPVPIPSTTTVVAGFTGPIGAMGKSGNKYTSIGVISGICAKSGTMMFQFGTYLSYIYGVPVYVSSAEIITNNFKGVVFAYDPTTGYMTIGNITDINGTILPSDTYTINVQMLTSIGPEGAQGPTGLAGPMGANGPTGPTGPVVPFSGGTTALITMFQYGFDCGDVLD